MPKKDYIIVAPKYCKSNGVRTLYRLAKGLEAKGYKVYVFAAPSDEINCNFISKVTKEMRKNAIVVYPEIVYGNPLGFQNVVRYILYYPGRLGGQKEYFKNELLISYTAEFYKDVDIMCFPCLDRNLFYKDDTVKDVDCYFVYKKGKWKEIKEFENMIEINPSYPKTREDLSKLLRRTKTLYSYDDCSLLLDEAYACGCSVKIVTEDGFKEYISKYNEVFKDTHQQDMQLENFIQKTQSMNYQGKLYHLSIKDFSLKSFISYYKTKFKAKRLLKKGKIEKSMNKWWEAEQILKYRC